MAGKAAHQVYGAMSNAEQQGCKEAVGRSGVQRHLVMFMCSKHAAQEKLSGQMGCWKTA